MKCIESTAIMNEVYVDITGIDLFEQNVGMICARVRLRSTWLSPVL